MKSSGTGGRRSKSANLYQLNKVLAKKYVKGISNAMFDTSPFLEYLKRMSPEWKLQQAREMARRYGARDVWKGIK